MVLNELMTLDAYTPMNKSIARGFGINASLYMGELVRQRSRFGNEEFYFTQDDMEYETCLSEHQQREALRVVVSAGFVTVEKKGLPARYFYRINDHKILEWMTSQSSKNMTSQSSKNLSALAETAGALGPKKSEHIYNKNDNKKGSKSDPSPEIRQVKKKNLEDKVTEYDVQEIYSYLGGNTKYADVTKLKGVAEKFCRIFKEVPIYQDLSYEAILEVFETTLENFMDNFKTVYVDRDRNLVGHETVERELAKFAIYYVEHPDKKIKMLKARLSKWIITASQPSPYAK